MADIYKAPDGQTWVVDTTGGKGSQITPDQVAQAQQRAKEIPVNAADAEKPGENHARVMTAPEGWVLDERPPTLQHQTRKISGWESAARGAAQGVTLGWSDELEAAIGNPFDIVGELTRGSTYQTRLADARRENRNASLQNPRIFGVSEFAGGMAAPIPGGAAGNALAGAKRAGAVGAGVGAAAGVGYSERPGAEALLDAPIPAAIGGAAAMGAHRLVNNAPDRVVSRTVGDITDGATAAMRDKVVGAGGSHVDDVFQLMRQNPEIRRPAATQPNKAAAAAEAKIDQVGQKLDEIYSKADAAGPALKVSDVLGALDRVKAKIANDPGKRQIVAAIDQQANAILETWGAQEYVPTRAVRTLASDLGEAAFAGNVAIPPKTQKAYQRQIYGAVTGLIEDHVGQMAKTFPELGLDVATMKKLNRDMSNLINVKTALEYRTTRGATPSTRLKDQGSQMVDSMLAFGGNPFGYAAKKTADLIGGVPVRAADYALARLVTAARNGSTAAQLGQMAIELGLTKEMGEAIGTWANRTLIGQPNPSLQQAINAGTSGE